MLRFINSISSEIRICSRKIKFNGKNTTQREHSEKIRKAVMGGILKVSIVIE
jgi:hypothetical protein